MYDTIKLEKGLYHIAGKSFSEMLEEMDPSEQYAGTPMADLDAYGRQLKRFHIRVSGPHCDRVEKFFSSTESAVLFPEFIRRAVTAGVESSILSEISAVHTKVDTGEYVGSILDDSAAYATTGQGEDLPVATYVAEDSVLTLDKYGRSVHATYESVRHQKLDAFAAVLRGIGVRLANHVLTAAVTTLQSSASVTVDVATSGTLTYEDLTNLYGAFTDFELNAVLASPANAAQIMALSQMEDMASAQPSMILLPFGAKLFKCPGMSDDAIVGMDTRFALEMVTSEELLLESDKLIDSQLDVITATLRAGFRPVFSDAIGVLSLTTTEA